MPLSCGANHTHTHTHTHTQSTKHTHTHTHTHTQSTKHTHRHTHKAPNTHTHTQRACVRRRSPAALRRRACAISRLSRQFRGGPAGSPPLLSLSSLPLSSPLLSSPLLSSPLFLSALSPIPGGDPQVLRGRGSIAKFKRAAPRRALAHQPAHFQPKRCGGAIRRRALQHQLAGVVLCGAVSSGLVVAVQLRALRCDQLSSAEQGVLSVNAVFPTAVIPGPELQGPAAVATEYQSK